MKNTTWTKVESGQIVSFLYRSKNSTKTEKRTVLCIDPSYTYRKKSTGRNVKLFVGLQLETTLRAHKNEEQLPSRNVPVDNKIYESILNFNIKDPKIFFIQFLDSIEKFGFYDAHFEPQFHFLFNKNGSERFRKRAPF